MTSRPADQSGVPANFDPASIIRAIENGEEVGIDNIESNEVSLSRIRSAVERKRASMATSAGLIQQKSGDTATSPTISESTPVKIPSEGTLGGTVVQAPVIEETFVKELVIDKLKRKFSAEPLVPFGALLTTAFLLAGFRSFVRGESRRSNVLMRGRVYAQAFTVIAVCVGGMYAGWSQAGGRKTTSSSADAQKR